MDMDSCPQTLDAALWTPAHRPGGTGGGRDIAELAGTVKRRAFYMPRRDVKVVATTGVAW
jgi:hypothetical protein